MESRLGWKATMMALGLAVILGMCHGHAGVSIAGDRKTTTKTFESSAAHSAGTEYSSGFLVGAYAEGVLLVATSGVSGTPTLTLVIETSNDNSTYYYHSTVAAITTSGSSAYQITNFGQYLRTKSVLTAVTECSLTYEIKGVFKN